jgi:phenylacetate-CoA ligase
MAESVHPDRAAIEAGQLEQLRSLVAELFPSNKFYAQKLQAAGITFDVASLADFSARFPFTTKQELAADQLANPPYGTNLTYPLDRYTRFHQTSGTSGAPLRWLDTPESWDGMIESWTQIFRAADITTTDRVMFARSLASGSRSNRRRDSGVSAFPAADSARRGACGSFSKTRPRCFAARRHTQSGLVKSRFRKK